MITISTGQCTFEGASRAEHAARQAIYVERLGASVRRCYRRHGVKIVERRDDGSLSVQVSHPGLSTDGQIERLIGDEKIVSQVRHLSGEAWQYAWEARLYRVGGLGLGVEDVVENGQIFRSAPRAVATAKFALGRGVKRVGLARTMADGSIGVYLDRAEMLRDETGEHARYTITRL